MTVISEHPIPTVSEVDTGSVRRVSAKVAVMAAARELRLDPTAPTEQLEGHTDFNPPVHEPSSEEYVKTKAERFAIAAVIADLSVDDLVDKPDVVREARFIKIKRTELADLQEEQPQAHGTIGIDVPLTERKVLAYDISQMVEPVAEKFLELHPEMRPAAERFALLSSRVQGAGQVFDSELGTAEEVVDNINETMSNLVLDEYIPFVQKIIASNQDEFSELRSPEGRLNLARDLAHPMLFSVAAINLGHLVAIRDSETAWREFGYSHGLIGSIDKTDTGNWKLTFSEGHERPAKPKTGLAGDTIGCPALLKLEESDAASPLHRLVYATINEAYDRGIFGDEAIELELTKSLSARIEDRERAENSYRLVNDVLYRQELKQRASR